MPIRVVCMVYAPLPRHSAPAAVSVSPGNAIYTLIYLCILFKLSQFAHLLRCPSVSACLYQFVEIAEILRGYVKHSYLTRRYLQTLSYLSLIRTKRHCIALSLPPSLFLCAFSLPFITQLEQRIKHTHLRKPIMD